MPVQKRSMDFAFTTGHNDKVDPANAQPGSLVTLENLLLTTPGSLVKRPGTLKFTPTVAAESIGIYQRREQINVVNRYSVKSLDESTGKFYDNGDIDIYTAETVPVNRGNSEHTYSDCVEQDGVVVTAWQDSRGGVYAQCQSDTGITYIQEQQLDSAGLYPKVASVDGAIFVFYADGVSDDINAFKVNTSEPSEFIDLGGIVTDLSGNLGFHAVNYTDERIVLAWAADGVIAKSRVGFVDRDGNLFSVQAIVSPVTASFHSFAIYVGDYIFISFLDSVDDLYVSWHSKTNLGLVDYFYDSGFGGANQHSTTLVQLDSDTLQIWWSQNSGFAYTDTLSWATLVLSTKTLSSSTIMRRTSLASHAWTEGSNHYVIVGEFDSKSLQDTYFVLRHDGKVVGAHLYQKAFRYANEYSLPRVHKPTDKSYYRTALNFKTKIVANTETYLSPSEIYSWFNTTFLLLDWTERPSVRTVNEVGYVGGGQLWQCDGLEPVESGFHLFPNVTQATTTTGGTNLSVGKYQYIFFYEWYNARGQLERSTGITAEVNVTATSQRTTIDVTTLNKTLKQAAFGRTNVGIVGYRTEVNKGDIYYRVTDLDITNTAGNNRYIENVQGGFTETFTDNMSDADLISNETDYIISQGVLENFPVESPTTFFVSNDRVFVPKGDRELVISKQLGASDPLQFSGNILRVEIPEQGGEIVTVAKLNERIVVFKNRGIYQISGFINNGGTGSYRVTNVNTDLGCISPNSVIETPMGLFFQSNKGIYLLGGGGALEFIGAPVDNLRETVTSAYTIPTENLVVFTTASYTLVFDHFVRQWTKIPEWKAVDADVTSGFYYFLDGEGSINKVVPGIYTDDGNPYPWRFKTSFIRDQLVLGRIRARRMLLLGRYKGQSHKIEVKTYYNSRDYPTYSVTLDPTEVLEASAWGSSSSWGSSLAWGTETGAGYDYLFNHKFKIQPCTNFAIEVTEVDPTGEGAELIRLGFEIGVYPNLMKTNNNRKF